MRTAASADGTALAFDRYGDGPPVIMTAGAFNTRSATEPLARALAGQFTVLNYDRRGRGDSGDTAPYAVDREVEDLGALVAAAGGSAPVFGYSSGATLALKAEELGLDLESAALSSVLETLKELEHQGYHFEVADGSLELLMRGSGGWKQGFFRLESFRILTEQREDARFVTEATIKLWVGDERVVATAEGNGPVNALDGALRKAIGGQYPELARLHLTDYRVRVLDTTKGTAAVTRVLLDTTDGERSWSTIGVSENIIEASWQALSDSIVYGLLHNTAPDHDGRPERA